LEMLNASVWVDSYARPADNIFFHSSTKSLNTDTDAESRGCITSGGFAFAFVRFFL